MFRNRAAAKSPIWVPYLAKMRCRYGIRNWHSCITQSPAASKITVVAKTALATMALLESLVCAEIGDRQTEGIDRNIGIVDVLFDDKNKVRNVALAARLGMRAGRVKHPLELDRGLVRRLAEVLNGNVFDLDLDLFGLARNEGLNGFRFPVDLHERLSQAAVQKIQGARVVFLDCRPDSAIVLLHKLNQEVFDFGFLRLVLQAAVVDGLGLSGLVDPD